jgi:hypothetical protein
MDVGMLLTLCLITFALAWVGYYALGVYQQGHIKCICGHIKGRHVTALDWDSNYGDPEHVGADYKAPGTCRDCWGRCRHFIPLAERA